MATHGGRQVLPAVNAFGALVAGAAALAFASVAVETLPTATLSTVSGALAVGLLLESTVGAWLSGVWYGDPGVEPVRWVATVRRVVVFVAVAAGLTALSDPVTTRVVVFGGVFVAGAALVVEDVSDSGVRWQATLLAAYLLVVVALLLGRASVGLVPVALAGLLFVGAVVAFVFRVQRR